jgi:hypothetical protein
VYVCVSREREFLESFLRVKFQVLGVKGAKLTICSSW